MLPVSRMLPALVELRRLGIMNTSTRYMSIDPWLSTHALWSSFLSFLGQGLHLVGRGGRGSHECWAAQTE